MTTTLDFQLSLPPAQGQKERAVYHSVLNSTVHLLQHVFEQATPDDLWAVSQVFSRIELPPGESDQVSVAQRLAGGRIYHTLEQVALETANLQRLFDARHTLLNGAVSASDVAHLLGVSRQTIYARAKKGTLLAVEEQGARRFPIWQFDPEGPDGIVAGLPDVLGTLPLSPFAQALWLTRPSRTFEGRTPLETLKTGKLERVVEAAAAAGAV